MIDTFIPSNRWFAAVVLIFLSCSIISFTKQNNDSDEIDSYVAHPDKQEIALYWKNDSGEILRSLQALKLYTSSKNKELLFAMNAGMYTTDNSPLGLYIEKGKTISSLNTKSGEGNFYLKPNGVFYISNNNKAIVCKTEDFKANTSIKYATQSGPMLVINGKIHPEFKEGSSRLNIRNGVGILPDNSILFAISKKEISFYDFAKYFQNKGCKNALYLDGFVSRAYIPEKNRIQTDGNFGVMIGVTKQIK